MEEEEEKKPMEEAKLKNQPNEQESKTSFKI